MVDKRFIGFLAIILIVTTMISMIFFQIEEVEEVQVLARRTPENIPGGRPGTPSYSFDLMAVRDLPDLLVRCHFLVKIKDPILDKLWNETDGREVENLIANVPRISRILSRLDGLGDELGEESTYETFEIEDRDRKLFVIDFTNTIAALAGEEQLKSQYTLYAFELDEYGNVSLFGGYRDFFFRRDTVINEIRYSTQTQSWCYQSERATGKGETCWPVSEAPMGKIHLTDLPESGKMHLEVTIDTQNMFGHSGIIRIVETDTGYGPGPMMVDWIGAKAT